MCFGSGVAVAVVSASSYRSTSTPSLGTSICHGCAPPQKKNKHYLNEATGSIEFLQNDPKNLEAMQKGTWGS